MKSVQRGRAAATANRPTSSLLFLRLQRSRINTVFDPIHEPPSREVLDHVDPYFIGAVLRADEEDRVLAKLESGSVDRRHFLVRELAIDKEFGRRSGEEFTDFLGFSPELRDVFLLHHRDLVTSKYWRNLKQCHNAEKHLEIIPYPTPSKINPAILKAGIR